MRSYLSPTLRLLIASKLADKNDTVCRKNRQFWMLSAVLLLVLWALPDRCLSTGPHNTAFAGVLFGSGLLAFFAFKAWQHATNRIR